MTVSSNATSVVTAWRNLGLNAAMSAFKSACTCRMPAGDSAMPQR